MGMTSTSRQLRRVMTEAEKKVWSLVRNRRLHNYKFLRQHPFVNTNSEIDVKFFVADFYCAELNLVVEIDGAMHNAQKEYDTIRTQTLESKGKHVIRMSNEEVLRNDFDERIFWSCIENGLPKSFE